jgi:glycosyltransferase involved in cell wall biosynthesis
MSRFAPVRDAHRVAIVVPTIGRPDLQRCLQALERQTRPADDIIVVPDPERRGAAWARNEGIRRSDGDLIAFTDDDCVVPEDWLERLIQAADRFGAAGAGGIFSEEDPLLQDLRRRKKLPSDEQVDTTGLVGSGGSVMYQRAWLERCAQEDGYVFNEAFRVSQDWELAWRMRRRGATLAFVPVVVRHCRRVNPGQFLQLQFRRGIGIAMLFRLQQQAPDAPRVHQSLLWSGQHTPALVRWAQALWKKLAGSARPGEFSRPAHFWWFWLGEKCQGVGFLWGLMRRYPMRRVMKGAA